MQFDYGLRQKRWLKPEERPDTFVTEEGKTITVDKGVAVQNFRTATRGRVRNADDALVTTLI